MRSIWFAAMALFYPCVAQAESKLSDFMPINPPRPFYGPAKNNSIIYYRIISHDDQKIEYITESQKYILWRFYYHVISTDCRHKEKIEILGEGNTPEIALGQRFPSPKVIEIEVWKHSTVQACTAAGYS